MQKNRIMQLTPLRILVALLCVTTFLFIEWALNGTQKSCGNRLGQEKQEEFNCKYFDFVDTCFIQIWTFVVNGNYAYLFLICTQTFLIHWGLR